MKKYELLLNDTKVIFGVRLYRIRYICDFAEIKSGELGGYIEKEENLSHDGNASVCGNAWVFGNASVYGNAWVFGNASVYGNSVCKVLSPLNIIGLRWNITLTDNNIHIGCKTFTLEKALKLASRWKETMLEYCEAETIAHEKKLIVEAIKLRLSQIKGKE